MSEQKDPQHPQARQTGAGIQPTGIGAATVRRLVAEGWSVLVLPGEPTGLAQLAEGGDLVYYQGWRHQQCRRRR